MYHHVAATSYLSSQGANKNQRHLPSRSLPWKFHHFLVSKIMGPDPYYTLLTQSPYIFPIKIALKT